MEEQNRNNICYIVLSVVITAIVVGCGVYWWQSTKEIPTKEVVDNKFVQTDTEQIDTRKKDEITAFPVKLVDTAITGTAIKRNYDFIHGEPEGFISIKKSNTIFMSKKAMAKLYENEENITSFYTPEHPTNSDIIFISTNEDITGDWSETMKITNKIYSYNIKTGEITQLYEEYENRLLRTIGMDGSKLILMYDGIENSPGPCFSVWADWKDFGYLELADIGSGLHPYTIPDYQIEIGKAEQERCIERMGF